MLKTYLYVPEELDKEVSVIAKTRKLSKAEVIRTALRYGIDRMKKSGPGSAEILLRLADLGRKNRVSGPKDASAKLDKYLWDRNWT